ncbi:MAG: ATP-binding protein [Thermodesulfobacteriota bacterium]
MDYGIIEKEIELAHADAPLGEKLTTAAGLIIDAYPFDQCLLYLKDNGSCVLRLRGFAGENGSREETYPEGDGLPGAAARACAPLRACRRDGSGAFELHGPGVEGKEVTDPGLAGFACSMAIPLVYGPVLHGVLFVKSRKRFRLSGDEEGLLLLAACEITNIIRCAALLERHHREHGELRDIQDRLISSEKLMALGDMAAMLAHEVKNPIISLGAFASKVKKTMDPDSPCVENLEHMLGEIHRVETIINGVIRFIRDNVVELEIEDLNGILDEALDVFADEFDERGIKLVRDYYEEPLPVMSDREQLKIAFDNIISNAIQSIAECHGDGGGALKVSTTRTEDSALIKLSDTGGGIDPDVMGRIFNPFFTTRRRGTGLGLAITNSIILRHRGKIEVDNDPGVGVTFAIKLPYVDAKEAG